MIDLEAESEGDDIEIIEQPACQPLNLKSFFKFNDRSLIHEKLNDSKLMDQMEECQK